MKTFLILSLGLSAAFSASGTESSPLLSKSNQPGFVRGEDVRSELCDLYSNKLVITRRYGAEAAESFTSIEERAISVDDGIKSAIERALAETLKESPNGLCDGPSTDVIARKLNPVTEVVLFDTGGCGSPGKERMGPASRMLRDLIDQFCPKTISIPHH